MAYRGRVLLELTTKLTEKPEHRAEDVPSDDLLVVEVRDDLHLLETLNVDASRPSFSLLLTEVPQKEEVFPVCGVLLSHAPARRRRRHPV